jgi:hypothetical protein
VLAFLVYVRFTVLRTRQSVEEREYRTHTKTRCHGHSVPFV